MRIDRIAIADSRLNFTDHFIKPNYTADVGELNGSITNLSSDPATRGVVDLKGSYDATRPVVTTAPQSRCAAIFSSYTAAMGTNNELPKPMPTRSAMRRYGITEGKLTLDVKYHIEDGKLQGRNIIFLDQLVFGDKVEGS